MDDQITALSRRYYELVNRDHHKDRDCHFSIEKVWSYGESATYRVVHNGYVSEWKGPKSFPTSHEAHVALLRFLQQSVAEEESYDPSDLDLQ